MAAQRSLRARAADEARPADGVTTLMFRGIPRKYTAWDLIRMLERSVDREHFDLVYVPWYKNSNSNMGYAFVNFVDATTARAVRDVMQGSLWGDANGSRTMNLMPAQVQGLLGNLRQYSLKNRSILDLAHRPLVFKNGAQMDLQETVRTLVHGTHEGSPSHPTAPKSPQSDGPSHPAAPHTHEGSPSRPTAPESPQGARAAEDIEMYGAGRVGPPPGLAGAPAPPQGGLRDPVRYAGLRLVQRAPVSHGAGGPAPPGVAQPPGGERAPGSPLGRPAPPACSRAGPEQPAAAAGDAEEAGPRYVHLGRHAAAEGGQHHHDLGHPAACGARRLGATCGGGGGGGGADHAAGPRRDRLRYCSGSSTSCPSGSSTSCRSGFDSEGSAAGHPSPSPADEILESPAYAAAWQRTNLLLKKLQAGGQAFHKRGGSRLTRLDHSP